jgi:hypothetical protein
MAAVAGLAATVVAAPADPVSPARPVKKAGSEVAAALDKSITLDLADQPLQEIINQLGTQAKVTITLDRAVLFQFGDPNQFVATLQVKDVPLRQALRKVLGTYNLTCAVVGDGVFVSTEDNVLSRQLGQRVDVELDEVPFNKALKDLARQTGVNLVIDPRVAKQAAAPVTLSLADVPLDAAVRLLAETADLRSVRVSNVIYVTTSERAEKLKADVNSDIKPGNPGVTPPFIPGGPVPLPAVGGAAGGIGIALPGGAAPAVDPAVPEKAPQKAE